MRISAIAAIGQNRELGKDNQLLWRIPEDFKYFKETTTGHVVIMGRKTFESINSRPLPKRPTIVVTRDPNYHAENVTVVLSIQDAIEKAKEMEKEEVFILGGGQIYPESFPLVDRLYLTLVHASFPDATTFFPDYSEFSKVVSEKQSSNEQYHYTFLVLGR